ncbi:general transcription factor 3C polypeptide 5 isoform X4 [Periplaneta americana]|uniref:general transcription factor 3C polypeptide 5 isoform X4 n=1 Tax=Periplaneta americana TaxID=6978 RepID=UPI0037E7F4DA
MNTEDEIDIHRFDRKLILVEYPGVVENEEKAIRTLGGLQNISTTYSLRNRRLELRFRPDDAFSKPACGDKHKTLSLLLKIKIRRKKKNEQLLCDSSAEDSDSSSSVCSDESTNTRCSIVVMGRIETAYRFKNLCDFQYLTMNPEFGDHGQMVCKYDSLVPIGLPTASWLAGSAPYFLPPATFSRMDTMQIFEDRPVWSKNALIYLTKYSSDQLKYLLPAVAYYFVTGPWRIMWVRFGYDPRKDPNALKYQTLDYRIRTIGGLKTKVKAKRSYCNYLLPYKSSPSCRPKTAVITKENLQPEKVKDKENDENVIGDNIYIFHPGTIPPSRQMFYQYCDIDVPEIQEMLEKIPCPPPGGKCHERLGWMPSGIDDRCREIISKLVTNVLMQDNEAHESDKSGRDQEKDSSENYDDEENTGAEENLCDSEMYSLQ